MKTEIKQLKGLFSLDHNIKIYIPSTIDIDKTVDTSKHITEGLNLFSSLFGGATKYDAVGAWSSQTRGLVTENIIVIESYATKEQAVAGLDGVVKFAGKLKTELRQEAISLEYDNKLYFI